jgi:TonB family protein
MSSPGRVPSIALAAGLILLPAWSPAADAADVRTPQGSTAPPQPRDPRPDAMLAALEQLAAENPLDPAGHQRVAQYCLQKVQNDALLTPAEKSNYIDVGLAATDRALTQSPAFVEALTHKSLLLRLKAHNTADEAQRAPLYAEADALRDRALAASRARAASGSSPSGALAAPPGFSRVDGMDALRVGGTIKTPTKVRDARPNYPQEAMAAGVSGLVILEAVIDGAGTVRNARLLRSIPMLDEAALEAVRQWQFTPTLLNGVPVPVMMTVTVNFTLK